MLGFSQLGVSVFPGRPMAVTHSSSPLRPNSPASLTPTAPMLLLIRRLTAVPSRLAALGLRRPHGRPATTTSTTPAVSSSRLAGSPPAEKPAADQGCEVEPLDRDWGSTLSRADPAEVVGILRRLHDEQIHLGLGTFNLLLERACEADDFALFAKVFRYSLLSKAAPDLTSYMYVARAIGDLDDPELMLKFVREVREITQGRDPTVVNRIVFATGRYGHIDKSLIIFEELKKDQKCLDVVTFNTVLDMLGKAGQVDRMLGEVKLMEELGISPDILTYNTVINCLRRLGRLDLCKSFATEMVERGISLDLRTYSALIDGFGRAGHITDALEAFDQMKKSHRPSVYVYRALISDLKKAGRFELAQKLSEEMDSSASDLLGPEDFKKFKGKKAGEKQMSYLPGLYDSYTWARCWYTLPYSQWVLDCRLASSEDASQEETDNHKAQITALWLQRHSNNPAMIAVLQN